MIATRCAGMISAAWSRCRKPHSIRDAVTHLAVLDVPLPGWSGWEATTAKALALRFHMNRDLPERLIHGREYDYVSAFMAERFYDHSTLRSGGYRDLRESAWRFLAGRAAAWNGIAPSPPIMRLRSSTRSSRSRYRCWLWAEISGLARRWCPMLQEFANNVSGGSIERCSHYVADERPDEVAAALIEFLKSQLIGRSASRAFEPDKAAIQR